MDAKVARPRWCAPLAGCLVVLAGIFPQKLAASPPDSTQARPAPPIPWITPFGSAQADALGLARGTRRPAGAVLYQMLLGAELGREGSSWNGHVSFLTNGGTGAGEHSGDLQGISNIEAPSGHRPYEAWVEWTPVPDGASVRLGLYDLNSEFYAAATAALFLHASHGIGSEFGLTGHAGPSIYPFTALAVRASLPLAAGVTWRAAIVDGAPGRAGDPERWGIDLNDEEGALMVSEVAWDGLLGADARVVLGAWAYTSGFRMHGSEQEARNNRGGYALLEGALAGCGEGRPCLRGFARVGRAAERINTFASGAGAGLVLEATPRVTVGGAVAWAHTGAAFMEAQPAPMAPHEIAFEGSVKIRVLGSLTLQPDVQYVHDPGLSLGGPHAWVWGVRVGAGF